MYAVIEQLNSSCYNDCSQQHALALRELHWLPIAQRIVYKLCLLVHKSIVGQAPVCMKNLLTAVADVPSRNFVIPRTRRKLGERAFSVAAPQAWNRLPTDLKTLRSTPAFKRSLKTFLFRAAYNVWFLGLYIPLLLTNFQFYRFFNVPDIVMRRRSICRRRTKSIVTCMNLYLYILPRRLNGPPCIQPTLHVNNAVGQATLWSIFL